MKIELLISDHCSGWYLSLNKNINRNFESNYNKMHFLLSLFHRRLYKIWQTNAFFSEVTKVDLAPFGNKLFIYTYGSRFMKTHETVSYFSQKCLQVSFILFAKKKMMALWCQDKGRVKRQHPEKMMYLFRRQGDLVLYCFRAHPP